MKILLLHTFNLGKGWGGSASILLGICNEFGELGHSAEVVSARRPDPFGLTVCELPFDRTLTFGPEKREGETTFDELDTRALAGMAADAAAKIETEIFSRYRPDLLIANHINLMALACWHLHQKFQTPYRIISHGTDTKLLLKDERYRQLFGSAARGAQFILAYSRLVADEAEVTTGGRVEYVSAPVDPQLFYPDDEPVKPDDRLVFMGRLVTEKGLWILLEAMTRQQTVRRLDLVGEGPLREEVLGFISRNSLSNRVTLLGYVPRPFLRSILIKSSAVVVPSVWEEPLGLVVLEAFACGVPVIASSVGGILEHVVDDRNGLLVPKGDASALAGAIKRLCGDTATYDRIRRNVRAMRIPTYRDFALRLLR